MGKFLESEKKYLITFKRTTPYFTSEARKDGVYRGRTRPFCLPRDVAEENLFHEIREQAIIDFKKYKIKWHDGQKDKPSNHLCGSQVCCVNFLFPFNDKPEALVALLRPLYPNIMKPLPMEDGNLVAMEWIGEENYLKEKAPKSGRRTRGANFTSADAAVKFTRDDGLIQIVLIEWKYTESYSNTAYKISKSGTDRTAIYAHLFEKPSFPLDKEVLPSFESLFYEPFYQFMRQQLLASEMERAKEMEADIVSLLHIAPAINREFQRVTSPALHDFGDTVIDVWKKLQVRPNRFSSINTEEMFGRFPADNFPQLAEWWEYILARYSWINEKEEFKN